MKILIVDDEPFSRRLVEMHLRREGYDVVAAEGAAEALEHLTRDREIALMVTDWMMPGMDGLGLCRTVRALKRERYLPILLLTSRSDTEDLVEALGAGADAFLSKPLHMAELQAHIKVAERILRLEQELAAAAEERAQLRALRAVTATARTLTDRINNPMMVIFGRCELLMQAAASCGPEQIVATAEGILSAADQVSEVVHALQQVVQPVVSDVPNIGPMLDLQRSALPASSLVGVTPAG